MFDRWMPLAQFFCSLAVCALVVSGCSYGSESSKVTWMGPRAKYSSKF